MEKYVIECEGEPPVYRVVLVVRTVQSAHQTLADARAALRSLENADMCAMKPLLRVDNGRVSMEDRKGK
jgi:hypothetical protein